MKISLLIYLPIYYFKSVCITSYKYKKKNDSEIILIEEQEILRIEI